MKEAVKGNDKALIEDKLKVLTNVSSKMAERVYAKKSTESETAAQETKETKETAKPEEGVVDAEFEEVKEDEDKK